MPVDITGVLISAQHCFFESCCCAILKFFMVFLQKEDGAIASVQKALKVLDSYLLEHTFLVGETVTLADIIAACNLYLGFTKVSPAFKTFATQLLPAQSAA